MTSPRDWSLRRRLAGRILVATAAAWCLALAVGLEVMWHEMSEIAHEALTEQARAVARLVDRPGMAVAGTIGERGSLVRVILPGEPPSAAPWPLLAADGLEATDGWTVVRVTTPRGIVVEAGQNDGRQVGEFWEAARVWLFLAAPLLGLLLLVVVGTVRGALAPVARLAEDMERRRASDLSPMPAPGLPSELLPIPRALDRYLARIEALLRAERQFSANAAHELRTPLAVASAQAQLVAAGHAGPQAAEAMVAAVGRVTATVERLLDLARAEAGSDSSGDRCDVVRVLRLLIGEAPPGQVRFDDRDVETLEVAADADSVALLLGNLLRNALEHGAGGIQVAVGPGRTVEIRNLVGEGAAFTDGRFAAGPGSRGSGLGLSIARAIVQRFGWELDLSIRDGWASARADFGPAVSEAGGAAA